MNIKKEAVKVAKTLSRYAITHDYSVFQAAEDGFVAGAKWALENQWIDVKDELPQYYKTVLIKYNSSPFYRTAWLSVGDGGGYIWAICNTNIIIPNKNVIAWMPIPKMEEYKW